MKQSVSPVVAGMCVAAIVVVALFVGIRALSPARPSVPHNAAQRPPKPAEINGHKVPNNVPWDYMYNHQARQSGFQPSGPSSVAPRDMMNGMPMQHP